MDNVTTNISKKIHEVTGTELYIFIALRWIIAKLLMLTNVPATLCCCTLLRHMYMRQLEKTGSEKNPPLVLDFGQKLLKVRLNSEQNHKAVTPQGQGGRRLL